MQQPLSYVSTLESARNGSLTPKSAAESAQLALKLLGNASANISMERRCKATTHLNPELGTLIDDEDTFREAAPLLFGKTFDQQARDHMEAVKYLKKTTFTLSCQPFPRGHPLSSRGGGTFRGRGATRKFSAPQRGKKLSDTCMFATFNENVECYKYLRRKRFSMHDTHYRSSTIKQGVHVTNQQHGYYTTGVRQHTDASGVRDHTSQADVYDSAWSPLHDPGPTNPSLVSDTEGSTMDSADQDGNNTNCSRALHNSNICRQNQPVPVELEGLVLRQLGPTDCDKGIPHSPNLRLSSTISPSQPTPTTRGCDSFGGGNQIPSAEAGNPTSSYLSRGVLFKHVPGTQKRGRSETCNKSQTSKQVCEIRAFQDGGAAYSQISSPEKRLDDQNRLKGSLLHDTNGPTKPSPPPFQSGEEDISIQLPPFWSMHRPQSVYQNPQASSRDVEIHGTSSGDIQRRHASHVILQRSPYRSHSFDPVSLREHRICNQREEVSVGSHPGNRISWNDHQLHRDGYKTPGPKNQRHQTRSPETSQPPQSLSTVAITADREAECNHPSSSDGPLFCRALQTCLKQALEAGSQDYQSPAHLSIQAKEDLQWWELHLSNWNGRSLISQQSAMTIISDALLQG